MIRIDPKIIQGLKSCTKREDLYFYLQKAIELEHATIPPYLTAMYSLMPGRNDVISKLIRTVVIEEMLHMTISANVLVAIGGHPKINHPGFIPKYPGPLPMNIGDGLEIPIKRFSKELLWEKFMKIEEPEDPIPIRRQRLLAAVEPEFNTIGEFYTAVQEKICHFGDSIFTVGPEKQVLSWFDPEENIPIVGADSAVRAIELIIEEGEGTSNSPFVKDCAPKTTCKEILAAKLTPPGEKPQPDPFPAAGDCEGEEVAHYYRFYEIYEGKQIKPDGKGGFVFSGPEIPFDEEGVFPMIDNPKQEYYEPGSQVATMSDTFSYGYSNLLNSLHESFNGNPHAIDNAIGLMYQLRLEAQNLMSTPLSDAGPETAGPVFRYVTRNPQPPEEP